jgi:hypothetical protein
MCGVNYAFGQFTQCSAAWKKEKLGQVDDLKQNFGGAPLFCPAAPSATPVVVTGALVMPVLTTPSTGRRPEQILPALELVHPLRLLAMLQNYRLVVLDSAQFVCQSWRRS